MEERGAGGGTVRLWSAVPSPGHKKVKNSKPNKRIAKILTPKKRAVADLSHKHTDKHPAFFKKLRNFENPVFNKQ